MNPFRFRLRFALRNILAKKGSAVVVIFTITIFITLIILSFSMYSVIKQLFYYDAAERYPATDVIISYDSNSEVRIINKRNLELTYAEDIITADVFLNLHTMVETESSAHYVELLSGAPYELERLIECDIPSLAEREAVITSSLSQKYQLNTGDTLDVFINNNHYAYQIKSVIEDTGFFDGDTIFVQKETLMSDLYGVSNLANLGNVIYVHLKSGVSATEFIQKLSVDDNYSGYLSTQTVNIHEIERSARYNAVLFFGIALLMMFALVMVMHSLFILFYKDYPVQSGVLSILGAKDRMLNGIWNLEMGFFILVSACLSILLTFGLINIAGRLYGVSHIITFSGWNFLAALGCTVIFIFMEILLIKHQIKRTSKVSLSSDFSHRLHKSNFYYGLVFAVILLIIWVFHPFSEGIDAIIIVITSVIVLFTVFDIVLILITKLMKNRKNRTLFNRFSLKAMQNNPYIHQSIRVLFIIFLVIICVLSVRGYVNTEFKRFNNQVQVDYAIMGIYDYDPSLITELETDFDLSEVNEAIVYQYSLLYFETEVKKVAFNVSMDYQAFQSQFQFETTSEVQFDPDSIYPQVLLPYDFYLIYGVEIGDIIHIDLTSELTNFPFEVVGFLDTTFDNLIYTTLYQFDNDLSTVSINTVFIQTNDPATFDHLIQRYAMQMYFVLDMDSVLSDFNDEMVTITNVFSYFTGVLVVCFIIILFNNALLVFDTLKPDYAKLKILGLNSRGFIRLIFSEAGLIFLIMILGSLIESKVLIAYFPKMMLVFHYYKEIVSSPAVMTVTFGIVGIVLLITYLYYLRQIRQMNVIEVTKKY